MSKPTLHRHSGCPVAIIGGKGYLGSHLSSFLDRVDCRYWVVGRQMLSTSNIYPYEYRSSVPDLAGSISGAYTVVHLATLTTPSIGEKNNYLDIENIKFTLDLIDACVKENVRHIIFVSSGGTIYGNIKGVPATELNIPSPSCSYAIAKLTCEHYLRIAAEKGLINVTVLRISNPYGGAQIVKGEQGVVRYLVKRISEDKEIILLGNTIRDYIYIDDVSRAFYTVVNNPPLGFQVYNISTGIGTKLTDLAILIFELLGKKPRFKVTEPRPFDLPYNVLNNEKIKQILGWSPQFSLKNGLGRYIAEFKELDK